MTFSNPPQEWPPRGHPGIPRLPSGIKVEEWRRPDVREFGRMVWYGPAGGPPDGDVATEAEREPGDDYWTVSEYNDVTGLVEDVDPDYPILKISRDVSVEELASAITEQEEGSVEDYDRLAERMLDEMQGFMRLAVSLGTQLIAYHGGDEEMVEQIPS